MAKKANKTSKKRNVKKSVTTNNANVTKTTTSKSEQVKTQAKKIEKNMNKKHAFRDFKAELKKIVWPSKKEWSENIIVVISMVIIVFAIIFVLDLAFNSLNKLEVKGVEKLKNSIDTNTVANETNEISTNEVSEDIDATNALSEAE